MGNLKEVKSTFINGIIIITITLNKTITRHNQAANVLKYFLKNAKTSDLKLIKLVKLIAYLKAKQWNEAVWSIVILNPTSKLNMILSVVGENMSP